MITTGSKFFFGLGIVAFFTAVVYGIVTNGSVTNSGQLSLSNGNVETRSDSTAGQGFTAGADYSITNTGVITSSGGLYLIANNDLWNERNQAAGTTNDSTGSVTS